MTSTFRIWQDAECSLSCSFGGGQCPEYSVHDEHSFILAESEFQSTVNRDLDESTSRSGLLSILSVLTLNIRSTPNESSVRRLLYQTILREHVMGSLFRLAFRQLRHLQPITDRGYCRSLSARKPERDRPPIRSHVRHNCRAVPIHSGIIGGKRHSLRTSCQPR